MVGKAASPLAAGKGGCKGSVGRGHLTPPERCLSRKAGIVRCCPRNEILLRDIWQGFGTVKTVPYG